MTWILPVLIFVNVALALSAIYLWIQIDANQREIEALEDWIIELEASVALAVRRRA